MRLFLQRTIAAILTVFLLVSLAACRNLPPPARIDSTGTTQTPPPESEAKPPSPDHAENPSENGAAPSESPESESIAVRSLIIDLEDFEIPRGSSIDPFVIIVPSNATDKSYTLESGNEEVLRLLGGRWTAVSAGIAELIATASNGVTASAKVTVIVPVESISLEMNEISMNRGDSVALTVILYPDDATNLRVSYESSNERVATVSVDGTINAVGAGTAVISISVGGAREEIAVTVNVPVTGISVSTDRRTYQIGDQCRYTVRITPEDCSDKAYTVSVSKDGIILNDDNSFTCEAGGEVTITATASNGITDSQTITIIDLAAFADEVFRLTNAERAAVGLSPLYPRSELAQIAEIRAYEIIQLFSHDRPDGREFSTVFTDNDVSYHFAGENLAAGQRTPTEAVRGWMNSPGHRENMLRREYGHLGVAVTMDGNGRLYWTQMFSN